MLVNVVVSIRYLLFFVKNVGIMFLVFSRNYFAGIRCFCARANKDNICRYCVWLKVYFNYCTKKVCLRAKDVPAGFKLENIDAYLKRRLKAEPILFYSLESNEIRMSLD